nr:MAG TPA: hypothetical protein [Caudoviricetes sp.]
MSIEHLHKKTRKIVKKCCISTNRVLYFMCNQKEVKI